MKYINVILLLIFNGDRIFASHFRGGMMNFEPLDGQDLMQVTYRFSWQQSYAAEYFCNASTVAESKAINVEGILSTVGGCAKLTFTPIHLRCTDYSEVDDWMSGTNSLQFECNASFVDLRYSGRSWLSVQNGGSDWSLYLSASLTTRSDTNKMNTSPVSVMQPIQQLLYGCQQNITIPVVDNDDDIIRCRWSTARVIDECGGICSKMPGITLNEGTCMLIYYPNIAPLGMYAVAVQVEDFINSTTTIPMSSIPVQFLIEVVGFFTTCDQTPTVTDSNLSDGEVIEIPTGSAFEDRVLAKGANNNDRIESIDTIGPEGMSKGALQLDQHDPTEHKWFVDVSWLPTDDQKGKHLFCYRAVSIAMVASPQTCKELLAGTSPSTSKTQSISTYTTPLSFNSTIPFTSTTPTTSTSITPSTSSTTPSTSTSSHPSASTSPYTSTISTSAIPSTSTFPTTSTTATPHTFAFPSTFTTPSTSTSTTPSTSTTASTFATSSNTHSNATTPSTSTTPSNTPSTSSSTYPSTSITPPALTTLSTPAIPSTSTTTSTFTSATPSNTHSNFTTPSISTTPSNTPSTSTSTNPSTSTTPPALTTLSTPAIPSTSTATSTFSSTSTSTSTTSFTILSPTPTPFHFPSNPSKSTKINRFTTRQIKGETSTFSHVSENTKDNGDIRVGTTTFTSSNPSENSMNYGLLGIIIGSVFSCITILIGIPGCLVAIKRLRNKNSSANSNELKNLSPRSNRYEEYSFQ